MNLQFFPLNKFTRRLAENPLSADKKLLFYNISMPIHVTLNVSSISRAKSIGLWLQNCGCTIVVAENCGCKIVVVEKCGCRKMWLQKNVVAENCNCEFSQDLSSNRMSLTLRIELGRV